MKVIDNYSVIDTKEKPLIDMQSCIRQTMNFRSLTTPTEAEGYCHAVENIGTSEEIACSSWNEIHYCQPLAYITMFRD